MTINKSEAEPSMEEILASIREIISSDSPDQKRQNLTSKTEEDILDLTHALPEEEYSLQNCQEPEAKSVEIKNNSPTSHPGRSASLQDSQNFSPRSTQKTHETRIPLEDPLISSSTICETAQAFHSLNKLVQESPRYAESSLNGGIGGQTVENLVRETLKPLLKEWLDVNLPTLVRWVVNEQVERIMHQVNSSETARASEKDKSLY